MDSTRLFLSFRKNFFLLTAVLFVNLGWTRFSANSGTNKNILIELFSSEGCSSCPPADEWMTTLRSHPQLWQRIFPIAFHVDYWNRLGWNDIYSRSLFTQRQKNIAASWKKQNIYTPGFVLNGSEWQNNKVVLDHKIAENEKGPLLEVTDIGNRSLKIRFLPMELTPKWTANIAVLGNGFETKVLSGENSGKTLKHEFVALTWATLVLDKKKTDFENTVFIPPAQGEQKAKSLSLVVWISRGEEVSPVQVVGGDWTP